MAQEKIKIMLTGCSGIGKTTICNILSTKLGIPFISGSYSDLVPSTKNQPHSEMITKDAKEIFEQDVQVINLRNKSLRGVDSFITDRCYIDSMAYMVQKLAHRVPECDMETFMEQCKTLIQEQCTHLIFLDFNTNALKDWEMENNDKRVMNRYYQYGISNLIYGALNILGIEFKHLWTDGGMRRVYAYGIIPFPEKPIPVLVLDTLDLDTRLDTIGKFLRGDLENHE